MKMTILGDYFNNKFHKPEHYDESIHKHSPSNIKDILWEAPVFYSHIEECVTSAIHGYKFWRTLSFEQRITYLKKYKEVVLSRKDDIAKAIALETGKPLWESMTEAQAVAAKVDVTITDSLNRIEKQTLINVIPGLDGHIIFKPLGPTVVIGPYNFPCHLANGQILSSLMAGNSIIFKPSEKTIYSSQILIECFQAAGMPAGVINFINGSVHTSSALTSHPKVKGVFFTGSHGVGMKIMDATYKQLDKMVALEMGGRNCTIINDYDDEEHVLAELLNSAYLSTGQRCTSTSIAFIKRELFDSFTKKFCRLAKSIHVDHATDYEEEPFMGPLVDELAMQANEDFHHFTMSHGAEALIPFEKLKRKHEGYYTNASLYIFKEIPSADFFTPEIFGPHLSLIPYDHFDDIIETINSTPYGLAGSIFTRDSDLYERAVRDIEVGILNLNRSSVGASSRLPFGGVKNSGNFKPAAVSMIDHCVSVMASLETMNGGSKLSNIKGIKNA